ncbi:hypothetical protein DVH24_013711 [Malus domestica]|uniref:ADP-ribosyl cyclase/cyclic ADP-ribose hydrolase n=1 Tax=Malus domestica TaxID=3750 RepID=A0A498JE51_MALDO|nr:hypothetical protein DVH24_013711 [Malus domestica]
MALVRTTQGTSSDSNTRRGYHYDVFLSFRGENTRKTFTDHLYTALISAGYRTFRDDDELETGEDIKSGLKQAIQMSRTSVIVFSKDYASSRWCLNELAEIVDHKRTSSDHVVIPVFYDVDPSHVRKQTGSIAEAFAGHRKTEPPDMMERWRKALAEVADLAGKGTQAIEGPKRSSIILSSFPCSLVELSLKGCNLSDDVFPTDLSNLSYLRRLYLDENPICSLPVFIKGLRRLDDLSFRNCNRLELLVGLPKVHQRTNIDGCISLRKIKYLPREQRSRRYVAHDNYNLVEWEHFYKLEPIDRVDVEIIKLLGLCNLESMPAIRMFNPHTSRDPKEVPVQGLYQYGIFSTFFAGNKVPGRFSYKNTKSSISFIVPLLLASHRIRGLNIFATYAKEENSNTNNYDPSIAIVTKVSNKSKGLKWIYDPNFYGIPGDGEDMIWLSHWKMEIKTILECGDQVVVSVVAGPGNLFRIKEFGVELVQEHQNNMMISTQHNTKSNPNYPFVIGGDLSMWEHIPRIYFLGWIKEAVENTYIFPQRFLNSLIMDTDEEDTDKEGQEDEPVYTTGRTRDASNNCGLGGWKVLLTAAGLFCTLALVVRSSISQKKKRQ